MENNEFLTKTEQIEKNYVEISKNSINLIINFQVFLYRICQTLVYGYNCYKDDNKGNTIKIGFKIFASILALMFLFSYIIKKIVEIKDIKKEKVKQVDYNFFSCHDNIKSFGLDNISLKNFSIAREGLFRETLKEILATLILNFAITAVIAYQLMILAKEKDQELDSKSTQDEMKLNILKTIKGLVQTKGVNINETDIEPLITKMGESTIQLKKTSNEFISFINFLFTFGDSLFIIKSIVTLMNEIEINCNFMSSLKQEKSTGKNIDTIQEIKIENFNFGYDVNNQILKNINLEIKPKMKVVFVGKSGSGKSTLARILSSNYDIESNNILFNGENISNLNLENLRKQTIYVSQSNNLFSGTVEDNLSSIINNFKETEEYKRKWIKECLDFVDIWKEIQEMPEKLKTKIGFYNSGISGGQKQRLLVATNMTKSQSFKNPKISLVVCDEATSALPRKDSDILLEKIMSTFKNQIVIIVDHSGFAVEKADLVVFFNKGNIFTGKHKDLLKNNDIYRNFLNMEKDENEIKEIKEVNNNEAKDIISIG